MRVFVYESVTASADRALPAALRAEGQAMRDAVLDDVRHLPGVESVTTEDAASYRRLARTADYTLVIAPEIGGELFALCRQVEEDGGQLLGPSSAAVALAADKLRLAEHLRARGVATPACVPADSSVSFPFPRVCKARDGAGSLATYLVRDAVGWETARRQAGEMIAQPYVSGQAASVAFLLGPRQQIALLPAAQHLSADGHFRYLGGSVPLPTPLAERAVAAARPAVEAVEGLRGYVGVDVVLGDGGDWVIEINPRLTTSYLGLRALCETNLAGAMLRVVRGEDVALTWRAGRAEFRAER